MTKIKACPILMRHRAEGLQILAFRHAQAGIQLVKGTVEEGESPQEAAVRELFEEAGVTARVARPLGISNEIVEDQSWIFFLCAAGRLPDEWTHWCEDDGGHEFAFFWHVLDAEAGEGWHPVHLEALAFLKEAL